MSYILYLSKFVVFFSIENQHIQFKVEPNARDIDASQVAQALGKNLVLLFSTWNKFHENFREIDFTKKMLNAELLIFGKIFSENDINVQKRLSNDLGVEISKAAAGKRVSQARS